MFQTQFEEYRYICTPFGNFWTGWCDWLPLYDGESPWIVTDITTKALTL